MSSATLEAAAAAEAGLVDTDVVLRDGSTVHVRSLRAEDEPGLEAFYGSLSTESRWLRFFSAGVDVVGKARSEAMLDQARAAAVVATTGPDNRIIGDALYVTVRPGVAEVAMAVADAFQSRGVGTRLLEVMAELAASRGVHVFECDVLASNYRLLEVLRESGFRLDLHAARDVLRITFQTTLSDEARERFERRERIAATNALQLFLAPRSIAVIGASRQHGTVGAELLHRILQSEFDGIVDPVNPAAGAVQGVRAYPDVTAVPGPVDLAIVAVPAARVVEVTEQCARKGVRALVVLSAGFSETDEAGKQRQRQLLDVCRHAGIRLIGPNCLGIINTDPGVRLTAVFAGAPPLAGPLGFASQSGALGLAAVDQARAVGLGISSFVSLGNRADVSSNDLLRYWVTDERTRVIALYLESFGNPRAFARIARDVGHTKPIVAVKSGRSSAGARASASHTGALLEGSDVTADALFRQAGVIRADTLEELFATAALLSQQPLPAGKRIGVVTNVGGPAILLVDACEAHGLEVPVLSQATQAQLRALLPAEASTTNPVDLIASATIEQYRKSVELLSGDPDLDAVVVMFIPPMTTTSDQVAEAIAAGMGTVPMADRKPVLAVFIGADARPKPISLDSMSIPMYATPELAASALANAVRYATWRRRPPDTRPEFAGLRRDEAAAILARALGRGVGWLEPDEVSALLACYGVPQAEQRVVATAAEAGDAAEVLGGAVALKAIAVGLLHKTDAGAVQLGLRGSAAVAAAAEAMKTRLSSSGYAIHGFLVQRMVDSGVEMLVGVVHDPYFGPIVACGGGGVLVELLKDATVRLSPVSREDASEMVRELKLYPLLTGYRGSPLRDVEALEDVILRLSERVEDLPEIAELDCNPVVVLSVGATVVDARVRVQPRTKSPAEAPSRI
jgi:acetyl coenzyme A synthetase (ADP forming)-like protein